jgi:hypothetical protein
MPDHKEQHEPKQYTQANNFTPAKENIIQWVRMFIGTVRPDWICMRVVSLESPLKGHQPLYVLNFLFWILNI